MGAQSRVVLRREVQTARGELGLAEKHQLEGEADQRLDNNGRRTMQRGGGAGRVGRWCAGAGAGAAGAAGTAVAAATAATAAHSLRALDTATSVNAASRLQSAGLRAA